MMSVIVIEMIRKNGIISKNGCIFFQKKVSDQSLLLNYYQTPHSTLSAT